MGVSSTISRAILPACRKLFARDMRRGLTTSSGSAITITDEPKQWSFREEGFNPPFRRHYDDCCVPLCVTTAVEAEIFRRYGMVVDLAPQELIDNNRRSHRIDVTQCLKHIKLHGISLEEEYPFVNVWGRPKGDQVKRKVFIRSYEHVRLLEETELYQLGYRKPVLVSINNGKSLEGYVEGQILRGRRAQETRLVEEVGCSHQMLLIGSNIIDGKKVWEVRDASTRKIIYIEVGLGVLNQHVTIIHI